MTAIPRYRPHSGPVILSAGFRPFFLVAAIWAAVAIPLWLVAYAAGFAVPTLFPPVVWHAHEMIFGFAAAVVSGFLLTAIPNWTGRMPLQGLPLATLVILWAAGRFGVLFSGIIGAPAAFIADLSFPTVFLIVVGREIISGKNWHNLAMLGALALLLFGNVLVHLQVLGITDTAQLGNRVGLATLFMLISLIGGRIIPSFTRNWLAKTHPEITLRAPKGRFAIAALVITGLAFLAWVIAPQAQITSATALVAGVAVGIRLLQWHGLKTTQEPLLLILHIGYGWLAFGLLLLGLNGIYEILPATAALHALTVGAVGTMTLAVMTRASLGHTGHPLTAGPWTSTIYVLITMAAVLRVLSPLAGNEAILTLVLAGASWSAAFGLFSVLYGRILMRPRVQSEFARPI